MAPYARDMTTSSPLASLFWLLRVLFWGWMAWTASISLVVAWTWSPGVAAVVTAGLLYGLVMYLRHLRRAYKRRYAAEQAAREAVWAERAEFYRQERVERADRLWEQHAEAWEREVA